MKIEDDEANWHLISSKARRLLELADRATAAGQKQVAIALIERALRIIRDGETADAAN